MRCASCGFENPQGTQFCEECGAKLIRACPSCGREVRPTAKFCGGCGTPLTTRQKGRRGRGAEGKRRKDRPESSVQRLASSVQKEAEECFWKAIDIARRQQAKSLELRAVVSLSRLWQQQGKQEEARKLLSKIYNWFTEGFDTKDLQEAKALLAALG